MGKIAFSIGTIHFSWFGLILATAILAACAISWYQVRLRRENVDTLLDLTLYSIPIGIFSARLYYVVVNWQLYAGNPREILQLWHGGLAIHGALIGIVLTIWLYSLINRISFWRWADIVVPGLAFAQAIGQWGNFINQDAFGYPTDAAWGIYIDYIYRPPGYEQFDFFHPTFLYESGWGLAIFILLITVSRLTIRKPSTLASGSLFLLYLILYSLGRLVIEEFRLDSEMLGDWRLAQIVSAIILIWSGTLLAWRNKKRRKNGEVV